ncbi:sugar ABC transporter substrate-binding protein [Planotetraspora silvatica]|uniref:Sugar ABC transporter substrate-binding protein n=1 Tax=Planotetraspora silvatica TaxID=234614 RepID=A0A8J3UE92_9ACTN|nr:sugar ABC transporter substrate-binding protein [Planotetraspora silvatica]GII43613.1 sugar ABC transporter substrate-binding protein [Planotetraspora silvatica]
MLKATKRATALAASVVVTALTLAGCSSSDNGGSPVPSSSKAGQAEIDKAMNTPTTLTFWTWVSDIDDEVKLFEQKYPQIKVNVENVGQGPDQYQKLRTALKSGNGAPDLAQIEYQHIPSFTITKSLLNLTPYGAGDLKSNYPEWIWNQVSQDGSVYAVPQDSGPMGHLYRSDIMKKAGITSPPKTWDEYAADAKIVKEKTGSYIGDIASNEPVGMVGLLWQAGAQPFGFDGNKTVTIDVNSAEAKKVYSYWQNLIQQDLVSTDPDFNDQWYQGFSNDKYAGWVTAAWGPLFLQGTVKDTAGKWAAAPLPQWNAGDNVSGNWGGSTNAVLSTTKNPIAAYELAKFINTDPASTKLLNTQQNLFPAMNSVLNEASFTDATSDFFGGQKINELFAQISPTVNTKFQWLPFMDYAYSEFNNTVGNAMTNKGDLSAAADQWQDKLVGYAKQQGFTAQQ